MEGIALGNERDAPQNRRTTRWFIALVQVQTGTRRASRKYLTNRRLCRLTKCAGLSLLELSRDDHLASASCIRVEAFMLLPPPNPRTGQHRNRGRNDQSKRHKVRAERGRNTGTNRATKKCRGNGHQDREQSLAKQTAQEIGRSNLTQNPGTNVGTKTGLEHRSQKQAHKQKQKRAETLRLPGAAGAGTVALAQEPGRKSCKQTVQGNRLETELKNGLQIQVKVNTYRTQQGPGRVPAQPRGRGPGQWRLRSGGGSPAESAGRSPEGGGERSYNSSPPGCSWRA